MVFRRESHSSVLLFPRFVIGVSTDKEFYILEVPNIAKGMAPFWFLSFALILTYVHISGMFVLIFGNGIGHLYVCHWWLLWHIHRLMKPSNTMMHNWHHKHDLYIGIVRFSKSYATSPWYLKNAERKWGKSRLQLLLIRFFSSDPVANWTHDLQIKTTDAPALRYLLGTGRNYYGLAPRFSKIINGRWTHGAHVTVYSVVYSCWYILWCVVHFGNIYGKLHFSVLVKTWFTQTSYHGRARRYFVIGPGCMISSSL